MRTMKKWFGALAMVALCATTSLLFTACGGGDGSSDDDGYYSGGGGDYTPAVDYNALLIGDWNGNGTNEDGESFSLHLWLNSDNTNKVIMSTRNGYYADNVKGWSASERQITIQLEKSSYPLYLSLESGSIQSGIMTVKSSFDKLEYRGTVTLTRDGGGGSDTPSGSEEKLGSTKALIIKMVESSGKSSYSSSTSTCYKMSNSRGGIDLYSNSSYTSKIGTASSNSLSTWGGYRVSSYDYLIRYSVTTHSSTYYFFN